MTTRLTGPTYGADHDADFNRRNGTVAQWLDSVSHCDQITVVELLDPDTLKQPRPPWVFSDSRCFDLLNAADEELPTPLPRIDRPADRRSNTTPGLAAFTDHEMSGGRNRGKLVPKWSVAQALTKAS